MQNPSLPLVLSLLFLQNLLKLFRFLWAIVPQGMRNPCFLLENLNYCKSCLQKSLVHTSIIFAPFHVFLHFPPFRLVPSSAGSRWTYVCICRRKSAMLQQIWWSILPFQMSQWCTSEEELRTSLSRQLSIDVSFNLTMFSYCFSSSIPSMNPLLFYQRSVWVKTYFILREKKSFSFPYIRYI